MKKAFFFFLLSAAFTQAILNAINFSPTPFGIRIMVVSFLVLITALITVGYFEISEELKKEK